MNTKRKKKIAESYTKIVTFLSKKWWGLIILILGFSTLACLFFYLLSLIFPPIYGWISDPSPGSAWLRNGILIIVSIYLLSQHFRFSLGLFCFFTVYVYGFFSDTTHFPEFLNKFQMTNHNHQEEAFIALNSHYSFLLGIIFVILGLLAWSGKQN